MRLNSDASRGENLSHAEKIVYVIFLLLLVSPVLPLLFAWIRLFKRSAADVPRVLLLFLGILSCSCALLITALFFKGALGPSYTLHRLMIIGANWVLALVGVVSIALQRADRLKIPLLISAALLLLVWSLNAALSSVA